MQQSSLSTSFSQTSDLDTNELLEEYDLYICSQARNHVNRKRSMLHPDTLNMEIDDLAQQTRIKIWQGQQKTTISNPKAYIRRVVHNESITMIRQSKPTTSLPTDEEGELYSCEVLFQSTATQDPLREIEQQETEQFYTQEAVHAISTLPTRQRQAMLCALKDKVDDLLAWVTMCKIYNMDMDVVEWPEEGQALQSMRSSVSAARKKLRPMLDSVVS